MTCSFTADHLLLLKRPIAAFAANEDQRASLLSAGIPDEFIWMLGRGVETLKACIDWFRQGGGTLVTAGIGRTLGESKNAVMEAIKVIESSRLAVIDVVDPSRTSVWDIGDHALRAIAGWARIRSRRVARRLGEQGGRAKGEAARARRNAIMAENIVRRFVEESGLTLRRLAYLFGPPFSVSTLHRHFKLK
jgi:uncharacterized SAM-binding protein YcdF (DUF218 family)